MHSQPIFFGEADFERWLSSSLEAERQRLKLEITSVPTLNHPRPAAATNENVHTRREGDAA